MDQNGDQNCMNITNDPKAIISHELNDNKTIDSSLRKRKRSKNIFKVMLLMMRGHSRKSKLLAKNVESKSVLKKFVGSMRSLHLQDDQSPSQNNNDNNDNIHDQSSKIMMKISLSSENGGDDGFESALESIDSPSPTSSRYASAVGLNEMMQEEEKKEEIVKEKNDDNIDGDEMIDAKAEEFIAQFYHQMRLQRLNVLDPHYQAISMRSLGL